jgi:hypothetical protein
VARCSGPEMGLRATDGKHFTRPPEKPGEDENRYALHSTKRRRDLTSAENGKGTRLSKVNQGDNTDYSLRGVTSGFINRQLEVVINSTTCGILAMTWLEWLTIESILNISITWICLQDSCFLQSLACLLPNVTFLEYTPNMLVPSVDYIFCSHMMPSKTQALWSDSRLKAAFVNILKPRFVVAGRWSCVPLELFHQEVGGSTDFQCRGSVPRGCKCQEVHPTGCVLYFT